MSILDFMCGKSAERAANLIREQEEMLAQSRIRHEIALLHAIRPRSRTSTLRVRTIRWKFMLSDLDMFHLHRTLRDVGAIQTLSTHIGEMSILQSRPSIVRTITHVTWPEARK